MIPHTDGGLPELLRISACDEDDDLMNEAADLIEQLVAIIAELEATPIDNTVDL